MDQQEAEPAEPSEPPEPVYFFLKEEECVECEVRFRA